MTSSTERFTKTVDHYIQYRPGYPQALFDWLSAHCRLSKQSIVADIGSGTGFFSKPLLERVRIVYGVEPNFEMRQAAEDYLHQYEHFVSVLGTAESTTLRDHSIDLITVATAFHWFDLEKTKIEFKRILKDEGMVCLIWNVRDKEHSDFLKDYEALLLKYGINYSGSPAESLNKINFDSFFKAETQVQRSFAHAQQFDFEGLKGRLLSTSYCPPETHPNFAPMMNQLKALFSQYQMNGSVQFDYQAMIYCGQT